MNTNNDRIVGYIYETTDYSKFKKLEGNRPVLEGRVAKIMRSMALVGVRVNPVVVNSNFEVVEGQGRVESIKRRGEPVWYVIDETAGVEECAAMNSTSTNWSLRDYIDSYCARGLEDYIRLRNLINEYKCFPLDTVATIATGTQCAPSKSIRMGNYRITESECSQARRTLEYLKLFIEVINRVRGSGKTYYYPAIAFTYHMDGVDKKRLLTKFLDLESKVIPVADMKGALSAVEDIYNDRARTRIYPVSEYDKYLHDNVPWYQSKYGKSKEAK